MMTATTDADGVYLFEYLPAGGYLVDVDTTDGDLPTDDGNRYVLTTNNDPLSVTLVTAQNYLDADFGFTAPGRIGDYVWQDNDNDGIQDENEPGIPDVTVTLYNDVNGDGDYDAGTDTEYGSTSTDASGIYSFTGVPSGTYVVVVSYATLPSTITNQTYTVTVNVGTLPTTA